MGIKKGNKMDISRIMENARQEADAKNMEQSIIDRAPELRELIDAINNATEKLKAAKELLQSGVNVYNNYINEAGQLATTVHSKIDSINTHIDGVMQDAPSKLTVSVDFSEADKETVNRLFTKQNEWMIKKMREHLVAVNGMFAEERRNVKERYKEYDGCYLGHYVQWFFWFFFTLGFGFFALVITMCFIK